MQKSRISRRVLITYQNICVLCYICTLKDLEKKHKTYRRAVREVDTDRDWRPAAADEGESIPVGAACRASDPVDPAVRAGRSRVADGP